MKKVILTIFILITGLVSFKIIINKNDYRTKFDFVNGPQRSDSANVELFLQNILFQYGESFRYCDAIRKKNYQVIRNSDMTYGIYFSAKDFITLNRSTLKNGNTNFIIDNRELIKNIDERRYSKSPISSRKLGKSSLVIANNILRDMEILSYDEFVGKIFDRSFAKSHIVRTHTDESTGLFEIIEDINLLPYNSGEDGRVLALDGGWNTVYHMGENVISSGINHYGNYGSNNSEFAFPTGLTAGSEIVNDYSTIYPIYICDNGNKRLAKVNYTIPQSETNPFFDGSTFEIVDSNLFNPYDVSLFVSSDTLYSNKIWISELGKADTQSITCIEEYGGIQQRFFGYKDDDSGEEYFLHFKNRPRLSVYSGFGVSILSFIDNQRNNVITCLLNENGTGNTVKGKNGKDLILANDILSFPNEYPVNSVFIHKTSSNTIQWPYIWVTSGFSPPYYSENTSMIHLLKVNKSGNTQYLG